jgi:hypothetical protein
VAEPGFSYWIFEVKKNLARWKPKLGIWPRLDGLNSGCPCTARCFPSYELNTYKRTLMCIYMHIGAYVPKCFYRKYWVFIAYPWIVLAPPLICMFPLIAIGCLTVMLPTAEARGLLVTAARVLPKSGREYGCDTVVTPSESFLKFMGCWPSGLQLVGRLLLRVGI